MKHIVTISRYLLAIVFIFSGFVKGVDPLGSAYKFHDYFVAFHLDFLEPLSLFFSFLLCAAELLIGLMLLFGVKLRLAAWGAMLFMLLFTPLTLILAMFNPVSDCGCFGDAIHLSNWQTFYKNLVFFAAAILIFKYRSSLAPAIGRWKELIVTSLLVVLALSPSIHGYRNLPAYDFRPYHVGVNIHNDMIVPDGAPSDEYITLLYYQKNGVIKEFDESNYPWNDSAWTFVDSKSTLIKKGYTPPIANFSLITMEGEDITDKFVTTSGYSFLVVASRLDKSNAEAFKKLSAIYYKASAKGYGFICATSSPESQVQNFVSKYSIPFPFVTADEVTLKTIIRSNPGLLLLYNGTVIGKWHWRNLPDAKFVGENMFATQIDQIKQSSNIRLTAALCAVLILLYLAFIKFLK